MLSLNFAKKQFIVSFEVLNLYPVGVDTHINNQISNPVFGQYKCYFHCVYIIPMSTCKYKVMNIFLDVK